jgi:chromosome segregation ATPase
LQFDTTNKERKAMIFTQRQAREKIQSLESRIAELESESQSKDQTIEQLRKDVSDASAESAPQSARIIELEEQVTSLDQRVEELETANADLTEKATLTAEKISIEASRQLAATGHPAPVATTEGQGKSASNEEIIAKFQAMPAGEERSAFFHQHKSILSIKS